MRATFIFVAITALALGAPAFVACDDGGGSESTTDTTVDDTTDNDTTDTVDPDTGTPPPQIAFRVVEPEFGDAPVEGAAVYFVPPGGEMTQVVTNGDGLASFDEPEGWPAVTFSVHWYHPGYVYEGRIGITGADLGANEDGAVVKLPTTRHAGALETDIFFSGDVTGIVSTEHNLWVSTDTGRNLYDSTGGDTFLVRVPPNTPFHWVALESGMSEPSEVVEHGYDYTVYGAATGESLGAAANFTGTIDLGGQSAALQRVELSFPTPTELALTGFATDVRVDLVPAGGWRPWIYSPFYPGLSIAGTAERLGVAAGDDFASGTVAWVEPDGEAEARTQLIWYRPDASPLMSAVAARGFPEAGSQEVEFMLPAALDEPPDGTRWRWDDVLTWTSGAPTAWSVMTAGMAYASSESEGIKVRIVVPPGVSEIDLSTLPSYVGLFDDHRRFYIFQADCGAGTYDLGCEWLRYTLTPLTEIDL